MAYWTCNARITRVCIVTVEAETQQEAFDKFEEMDWEDVSYGGQTDWEIIGKFKKDEE